MVELIIKPLTAFTRRSWVDSLLLDPVDRGSDGRGGGGQGQTVGAEDVGVEAPDVTGGGPAMYYVSHAWSLPFLPMVGALVQHLGGVAVAGHVRVFLDVLCVTQHCEVDEEEDEGEQGDVSGSYATLLPGSGGPAQLLKDTEGGQQQQGRESLRGVGAPPKAGTPHTPKTVTLSAWVDESRTSGTPSLAANGATGGAGGLVSVRRQLGFGLFGSVESNASSGRPAPSSRSPSHAPRGGAATLSPQRQPATLFGSTQSSAAPAPSSPSASSMRTVGTTANDAADEAAFMLRRIEATLASVVATLVYMDEGGTPFRRLWCLFEFDCTIRQHGHSALVFLRPGPYPVDLTASVPLQDLIQDLDPDLELLSCQSEMLVLDSTIDGTVSTSTGAAGCLGGQLAGPAYTPPTIQLEEAGCSSLDDRRAILASLSQHHRDHGTCAVHLQLSLLLQPLDYSPDFEALLLDDPRPGGGGAGAGGGVGAPLSHTLSTLLGLASPRVNRWNLQPLLAHIHKSQKLHLDGEVGVLKSLQGMFSSLALTRKDPDSDTEAGGAEDDKGAFATRATCITGGPGSGKSSVAAAVCSYTLGGGLGGPSVRLVHAFHLARPNDAARQDALSVIGTLAYQLAHTVPSLRPYYAQLQPREIAALRGHGVERGGGGEGEEDWGELGEEGLGPHPPQHHPQQSERGDPVEAAFNRLLLQPLLHCKLPVVLLLDGVDQGSGPVGGAEAVAAEGASLQASNPVMQLLVRHLCLLPPSVYLIFTLRR